MKKYITAEGKKHLLRLGFINDDNTSNFRFCALGISDSNAAINNGVGFEEASSDNYHRTLFQEEESAIENTDQSLVISATFDSTNFAPSQGVTIKEIGIVNQDTANDNDKWFAFMRVPNIAKTDNVSLKYTVIISIE